MSLEVILIASLIATILSLGVGLIALFKGGDFNRKYGNMAMRWRILLQAFSVLILFLLLCIGKK